MSRITKYTIVALTSVVTVSVAFAQRQEPASTGGGAVPTVSAASAPPGAESLKEEWVRVAAPGVGAMLEAVARPQGAGPFPTVILLHGSHGFALEYVKLAESLAHNGVLALAPCWFSGGSGAGMRFITPIACSEAPQMGNASGSAALQTVRALVQAALSLPGVRPGHIALLGHSRGAGAALDYVLDGGVVGAVILDSGVYPDETVARVSHVAVPVLMLHGTDDSPADGGAPSTDIKMARRFEEAMRQAGKTVEAKYYDGGRHNGIFMSTTQYDDEVQRIASFVKERLAN